MQDIFTNGDMVRRDLAALAITKPTHSIDDSRSFALDGTFHPTPGSKSL
jgi:hypothetical protein